MTVFSRGACGHSPGLKQYSCILPAFSLETCSVWRSDRQLRFIRGGGTASTSADAPAKSSAMMDQTVPKINFVYYAISRPLGIAFLILELISSLHRRSNALTGIASRNCSTIAIAPPWAGREGQTSWPQAVRRRWQMRGHFAVRDIVEGCSCRVP